MTIHSIRILAAALLVVWPAVSSGRADEPRYAAQFFNGERGQGLDLYDWHDPAQSPRLDNRMLFDATNPVRWVEDLTLGIPSAPGAFVEYLNGDRLPGRVVEYRDGNRNVFHRFPPHLIVESTAALDWPDALRPEGVRLQPRWLRRVVWQRRSDERLRPGTLFYLDGRQVEFRSLRWSRESVRLLLEQETRDVPFSQIAEIHFPRADCWLAWFEQLALLCPDGRGLVAQFETADGTRATASTERFFPVTRGGANPEHWFHAVQPAWALEPLWLRHRLIRMRRYFRPHELPLTALEPVRVLQRSSLGGPWNWRRDASVQNGPLGATEQTFGWGLGVHAHSELEYELHPAAIAFRSHYGLDRLAGKGGCVRAAVLAGGPGATPLLRSDFLIGAAAVHDTGRLALPTASGPSARLTLVADAAHDGRPAAADPLEIRDTFDWWQPLLELDAAQVRSETRRLAAGSVPLLLDWSLVEPGRAQPALFSTFDQTDALNRVFRTEVAPGEEFFALSRRMTVGDSDRWLVINACRLDKEGAPPRVQVRIDERAVALFEVPWRSIPGDAEPLLVPVDKYQGRSVLVELFQIAGGSGTHVEWRAVTLVESDPRFVRLFDDEQPFIAKLTDGGAQAAFTTDEKYTGTGSVRLSVGERENGEIPGWNFAVRANPKLGEYRYLRFAWKNENGRKRALHLASDGRFAPVRVRNERDSLRYATGGSGRRDYGTSISIDRRSDDWEVVSRDLFGDFGEFNLTGLRLLCPDGDAALFDHIYLVRRSQDFDRLPSPGKPAPFDPVARLPPDLRANVAGIATDPARYGELVAETAPQFSASASGQGVWLLREHLGRKNVLRTHPPQPGQACVLIAPVHVPASGRTTLHLGAAPQAGARWQLLVTVSGDVLHDETISAGAFDAGWKDVSIDLSRFAGRNIVVAVSNQSSGGENEFAYWSTIDVRSE
jgi:hypothetical protein